jgi:hypothetical protein
MKIAKAAGGVLLEFCHVEKKVTLDALINTVFKDNWD